MSHFTGRVVGVGKSNVVQDQSIDYNTDKVFMNIH